MTLRPAVIFASLLTVALVAACGGSDDGASDPEADYREAVRAISERRGAAIEAPNAALGDALRGQSRRQWRSWPSSCRPSSPA